MLIAAERLQLLAEALAQAWAQGSTSPTCAHPLLRLLPGLRFLRFDKAAADALTSSSQRQRASLLACLPACPPCSVGVSTHNTA